jgi:hypothetical protein
MTDEKAQGIGFCSFMLATGTALLVGHYHGTVLGAATFFLSWPIFIFLLVNTL